MNSYNKKGDYRKPRRDNKKAHSYYSNAEKDDSRPRKGGKYPKNYNRGDRDDHGYVYKRKTGSRADTYIYKQDLIQKGLEVAANKAVKQSIKELVGMYSECIVGQKRKVIVENYPDEESHVNKSKLTNKEDLKEDFEELMDNEEIPDWFIDDNKNEKSVGFDFGATVSRTLHLNKEITTHVNDMKNDKTISENISRIDPSEDFKLDDLDFNELDNYLEHKTKNQNRINESFDDDGLYREDSEDEEAGHEQGDKDANGSHNERSSHDNSKNYFNNLEENIKNMLFNNQEEEEEESEESFEESLGFDNQKRSSGSNEKAKDSDRKEALPEPVNKSSNQMPQDVPPIPPVPDDPLKNILKGFDLPSHIEERKKISKEERELKKKYFLKKYGFMDSIICQIVYEILSSKKRDLLNKHTANGFNQKSVQKFCANKYKIFSMFMQGNIVSKVWMYKDRKNVIQGPFMSYDMDIWNNQENFFDDETSVAMGSGPFLPLQMYVDRDPIVIEIVDAFLLKSQQMAENFNQNKKKRGFNNNRSQHQHQNYHNNQRKVEKDLKTNYQEKFPAIGTTTANKWESPAPKNEAPLLDILRSGNTKSSKTVEEKAEKAEKIEKPTIENKTKEKADKNPQNNSNVEIKLVKSPRNDSQSNIVTSAKTTSEKKDDKPIKKPNHTFKEEKEILYVEKKPEPSIDGNPELTNNLKNLLGL